MPAEAELEEGMQESYAKMIAQAERRLGSLKEHQRVAIQNFEVFTLDYTDLINGFTVQIEQAAKVLHHLHSMQAGRPPPMTHEGAARERDEEQERMAKEFRAPSTHGSAARGETALYTTEPVVPPPHAVTGEIVTTWNYIAGTDWSGGDKIDERGRRHVHGRDCANGHPNALHKEECQVCKQPLGVADLRRYRIYDMATGKLLSNEAEPPSPPAPTENGVTP